MYGWQRPFIWLKWKIIIWEDCYKWLYRLHIQSSYESSTARLKRRKGARGKDLVNAICNWFQIYFKSWLFIVVGFGFVNLPFVFYSTCTLYIVVSSIFSAASSARKLSISRCLFSRLLTYRVMKRTTTVSALWFYKILYCPGRRFILKGLSLESDFCQATAPESPCWSRAVRCPSLWEVWKRICFAAYFVKS